MRDKYTRTDPLYILIGVMVVIAGIAITLILTGAI